MKYLVILVFILTLVSSSIAIAYNNGFNEISSANSTNLALSAGSSFTGEWDTCFRHRAMSVAVSTDQDGTLKMQFSPDKTNIDSTLTYNIDASVVEPPHRLEILRAYCRVLFTNTSASDQTYLRLQTIYGDHGALSSPLNSNIHQDADGIVTRTISSELSLSEGRLLGFSVVQKFGENKAVTTVEDVIESGGTYLGFPSGTPEAIELFSGSSDDDEGGSGCEKVAVYGLDADGLLQDEVVTLNGTSPVDTVNTYSRAFRLICTQSANGANTGDAAGIITARWTTTTSVVFATIPVGLNQSRVGCYTIPSDSTGFVESFSVNTIKNSSAVITGALWVRNSGTPARLIRPFSAAQLSAHTDHIYSGIRLPASTDICVRVLTASASVEVFTNFDIILIKN